jgi:hypothetical protein
VYYSKTWLIQNSSDQIRTFFELWRTSIIQDIW